MDKQKKKRILNLLPRGDIGGVERLCLDVARYSEDDSHFYFMWSGGAIADSIKKYTNNVEVRDFFYKKIIAEYRHFKNYIDRNEIEIIVVQIPSPVFLLFSSILRRERKNIKICVYIHSDPKDIFPSLIKRKQFDRFAKTVDGCIAISNFVAQEAEKMFDIRKLRVIYNGTDIERFKGEKIPGEKEKVRLIYVGRLIKEKGVDLLIRILSNVNVDFVLTVVGDGPCREQLELLIDTLDLRDKIQLLGARDDVARLLKNADIFVHPAIWNEGFGISIIEAMAAGVPCVAFRKGAVSEIITDHINGFLVDDFSEDAYRYELQEVMNLYVQDQSKFKTICDNARKRADDFNIQHYVKELSEYMHSL